MQKELFYFAKKEIMVQLNIFPGYATYRTHRAVTEDEKEVVERYFSKNIEMMPDVVQYAGVDNYLAKQIPVDLKKKKQEKQSVNDMIDSILAGAGELPEVNAAVKDLIESSMQQYYFDKIGDTILEIRDAKDQGRSTFELERFLAEYCKAYNELVEPNQRVYPTKLID